MLYDFIIKLLILFIIGKSFFPLLRLQALSSKNRKMDFKVVVSVEVVRSWHPKAWSFVWGPIPDGNTPLTRKNKMRIDGPKLMTCSYDGKVQGDHCVIPQRTKPIIYVWDFRNSITFPLFFIFHLRFLYIN